MHEELKQLDEQGLGKVCKLIENVLAENEQLRKAQSNGNGNGKKTWFKEIAFTLIMVMVMTIATYAYADQLRQATATNVIQDQKLSELQITLLKEYVTKPDLLAAKQEILERIDLLRKQQ